MPKGGSRRNTVGSRPRRQGGSRQSGVPSGPYAKAGIKGTQSARQVGPGLKRASNNV